MSPLDPAMAEILDDYVGDVLRHLPARSRADIGLELRTILEDALAERVASAGRTADEAMVLAVLRDHGTPRDVADRYRRPGLVIIRASESGWFLRLALAGVLVQWAITLPAALGDGYAVGRWWLSSGLGALWWPGALVLGMAATAWWRARTTAAPVPAHRLDRERIDRRTAVIELAAIAVGATVVCALPWLASSMSGPLSGLFTVDDDFLRTRAWPAAPLYAATIAVRLAALRRGRRSRALRAADLAITIGWLVTLGWWAAGEAVFVTPSVDVAARGGFLLCIGIAALALVNSVATRRPPIGAPGAPR